MNLLTQQELLNLTDNINIFDRNSGIYFLFNEKELVYVGIS